MKNLLIFLPAIVAALFCLNTNSNAQSPPRANLSEAKLAIAASNNNYFQAFAKNDSGIFVNSYAEDCKIMLPSAPSMNGHRGALEFFKIAYDKIGLRNGKFTTIDVYDVGGDYVAEEGFWESFDKNNKLFDHGKFLVLWKKTDRGWKMYRDSFNSDRQVLVATKTMK